MLTDLLFPKVCLGCGFLGCYVCLSCEKKLTPVTINTCLYCGKPSYLGFTHPSCKNTLGIDGVLSMFRYNLVLQKIIKNIKYKGVYDAFHELFYSIPEVAILKFYRFKRLYTNAFLQPIPLYKTKMKSRGFNQSVFIANFFQSLFEYKKVDLLIRSKETRAQAQIKDRQSRYINMRDAFSVPEKENIPSDIRTIILVDDVVTTGSTVKEAAQTLKNMGIKNVFVYSFARG